MTDRNVSGYLPNMIGPVEVHDDSGKLPARGTLKFSGSIIDDPDNDRLIIPSGGSREVVVPAYEIDWNAGDIFTKTLPPGAHAFTFANVATGVKIVEVTGSSSSLSWPAGIRWPEGVVPTQTPSGTDIYTLVKTSSGVSGTVAPALATGPAPHLTSIAPTSGAPTSAVALTLTGTAFVSGCTVKVGGSAATSVVFGSSTSVTCNTPNTLAAGSYDVVITNPDGQSSTLAGGYTVSSFSEAGETLSLWLEEDFAASPWTSTASAGTSGGRVATQATNPPTPGTVLGGKHAAAFNGTNQLLSVAGGLVASNMVTAGAGGIMVLYKASAGQAAAGADANADPDLIGGDVAIGVNSTGVSFRLHDAGGAKTRQVAATHNDTLWHAAFLRWGGGTMEAGVDHGAMTAPLAVAALDDLSNPLRLGMNFDASLFYHGEIREVKTWLTKPDDTERANVIAAWNAKYGGLGL